jgi:ATP-dependent RNA helicase SUPV3L1/SUV3
VLKSLSSDPELGAVRGERAVRRLWAACGLPDFRKTGPEQHARLAARLFAFLNSGDGPHPAHLVCRAARAAGPSPG